MPTYTYNDIDVAGSSEIRPLSISDSGSIVGLYFDAAGKQHGFEDKQGVVTTVDVPGAVSTSVADINASGELVGTSNSNSGNTGYQAFTDIGGNFQTIVIPGAVNVSATSVNDSGQVVGNYYDTVANRQVGFLYANGQSIAIAYPSSTKVTTYLNEINNKGQIAGSYTDDDNKTHSFIYTDGVFTPISVPGSQYTNITGLNNLGQVTGLFYDGVATYGYVESNGVYTTFGVPGATSIDTSGINDAGEVTGSYNDAANQTHAFVEKNGVVTVIDDAQHPNAAFYAINNAGEVVGVAESNSIETLFTAVLTPPSIAGTTANQPTTDRNPVAPFATATVTDPNGSTDTLTISLAGGGGTLSGAGLKANADGTYTLAGPAAAVTKQLDALQFTPTGAGAPGSSNTTRFTLSDTTDVGTTTSDKTTTVVDTLSGTPTPSPTPSPAPAPATSGTVSVSSHVTFKNGVFTLSGTASSPAGVSNVEIMATLGSGEVKDLGAATVDASGNFNFADRIGKRTQSFISATLTDKAGGTASGTASYSLAGGLDQDGVVAEQDVYNADGSAVLSESRFQPDGERTTDVLAPGQSLATDYADAFNNNYQGDNTFVYDPGHGSSVVNAFKLKGDQHDTLSFSGPDFDNDVANVLNHSHNASDGSGVIIRDPTTGDTVQLAKVTKQELSNNQGDIALHA